MVEGLADVLRGIFSTAAWEMALRPGFRSLAAVARKDPYRAAVSKVDAELKDAYGDFTHEESKALEQFLMQPEVASLVRTAYTTRAFGSTPTKEDLCGTFAALWKRRVAADSITRLEWERIFDALITGCDAVIDTYVARGSLEAFDAREAIRQNDLVDRLDAVRRELDLLVDSEKPFDLGKIDEFRSALRLAVGQELSEIQPPSFEGARPVAIDDLYVDPEFSGPLDPGEDGSTYQGSRLGYEHLLQRLDRTVVIGNPGTGKSTLTTKICHDLVTQRAAIRFGVEVTPVRVELRKLDRGHGSRWPSLRNYIQELIETMYGLDVPDGAVEHLLLTGQLFVVFDGLDELSELESRRTARQQIQAFARRYPASPVLVTSRITGYDHAALDPSLFSRYRLHDFDYDRVAEYVQRWFELDKSLSEPEREQQARSFLHESDEFPDLRSTPLMLALMCLFYRGNGYIPRNRPQVYERCASMLFEAWDRQRGIKVLLPIEEHLRPLLRYLAFWFWSNPPLRKGVPESVIVDRVASFLDEWRFTDAARSRHAAQQFVDFCRGRAWVFSMLGRDKEEEPLFGFTHTTFLEFFSAEELANKGYRAEELARLLAKRLRLREWDLLSQLVVQLQARQLGRVDQLLLALTEEADGMEPDQRAAIHEFTQRVLSVVVPRPETVQALTEAALGAVVATVDSHPDAARSITKAMLHREIEASDVVSEVLERELEGWLSGEEIALVELAAEIALPRDNHRSAEHREAPMSFPTKPSLQEALMGAGARHEQVALAIWWADWADVDTLLEMAGPEALVSRLRLSLDQTELPSPLALALRETSGTVARGILETMQTADSQTRKGVRSAASASHEMRPMIAKASPLFDHTQEELWRFLARV
jgi:hypothetical protein